MENIETSIKPITKEIMPVHEMWSITKGEDRNWGVEGYEPVRKYFDSKKIMNDRERVKRIKETKPWPPSDWPKVDKGNGKESVPPKRPNYLDQVYKWSRSSYDEDRAKKIIEDLESKNRPIDKKVEKETTDPRKFFEESQKKKKEREANYSEYPKFDLKIEWIDKAKERIKRREEEELEKSAKEDNKRKHGSLPTADRITVVSDAQYLGEKNPFYNTVKKENEDAPEEDNKKKKKTKTLFYPDVLIFNLENFSME